MFFKRAKKNNPAIEAEDPTEKQDDTEQGADEAGSQGAANRPPAVPGVAAGAAGKSGHAARYALAPTQLRHPVSPDALGFEDTSSIDSGSLPPVNERAASAIRLALALREGSTHVLAVGAGASGLRDTVFQIAEAEAVARSAPSDWVFVTNFAHPERPRALRLPSGQARKFAAAVSAAVTELSAALPAAFASDDYQARHRAIHERFRGSQDEAFETLQLTAREQNIAVLRSPTGFALAPTLDGKVVKPEIFAKLPPSMQADVNKKIEKLEADLTTILENEPKAERARRVRIAELDADVAEPIVAAALAEFTAEFAELEDLKPYLAELGTDMVGNVALFRDALPAGAGADNRQAHLRYGVLVVTNTMPSDSSVHVFDPLAQTMSGTIAGGGNRSGNGPHIFQLRPSALQIANGGILIVEAGDLLADPAERQALREALRSGRLGFRRGRGPERAAALASLDPEPIPLEATVIVIAEPPVADALQACDPALTGLLTARAGFAEFIDFSEEACRHFAQLMAGRAAREKLRPLTADAVAGLIDEAVRASSAPGQIALHSDAAVACLREADARAAAEARARIERSDIALAADETRRRAWSPLPQAGAWPSFDAPARAVGSAAYLTARQVPDAPAHPALARVTAALARGQGLPGDFVSVVAQCGSDGTEKAVSSAVWSALMAQLEPATCVPLAVLFSHETERAATSAVSATIRHGSTAALCALLSALSQTPLIQHIAIAAALRPSGELASHPHINDAIEYAFDAACAAGLEKSQSAVQSAVQSTVPSGVLIAACDEPRLMLADRVVEAVKSGTFNIWAAKDAGQAFAILTESADGASVAKSIEKSVASGVAAGVQEASRSGGRDAPAWKPAVLDGLARFADVRGKGTA